MNLNQWAIKWGVSFEAVEDLRREFGTVDTEPETMVADKPESFVQSSVRLEASKKGLRLFRNNSGAVHTEDGRFIRFGLCNDSERVNKVIKSADLIGIRPVVITRFHVGHVFGQFVARECKPAQWRYGATEREVAQLKFLELIMSLGGDAAFATGADTL